MAAPRILDLTAVLAGALALGACDRLTGSGGAPREEASSLVVAPTPPSPAAGESTGIPECDAFLAAYECYFASMPGQGMPQTRAAIAQMRSAYKNGAATGVGRGALAASCTQQLEGMKPTLPAECSRKRGR